MKSNLQKYSFIVLLFVSILDCRLHAQNIIESIQFEGNEKFSDEQLIDWTELTPGGFFNNDRIKSINKKIIDHLSEEGYLYAQIDSISIKLDQEKQSNNLIWYIKENLPFFIGLGLQIMYQQIFYAKMA